MFIRTNDILNPLHANPGDLWRLISGALITAGANSSSTCPIPKNYFHNKFQIYISFVAVVLLQNLDHKKVFHNQACFNLAKNDSRKMELPFIEKVTLNERNFNFTKWKRRCS